MSLNPSQQKVASQRGARTLALAGAGTGKTTTCIHWVAELIHEGTPPRNVLMLTFTRKAAKEMKDRVMDLCQDHPTCDQITVGNYHSIAHRLIRLDPKGFGMENPNYTILNAKENQSLWKAAIKKVGIPKEDKTWDPKALDELTSKAINWCKDPLEFIRAKYPDDSKAKPSKTEVAISIYNAYLAIKKERNSLSFDDLLLLWLSRLQKDPNWAKYLRDRYPNVLVDELQDNNPLNAAIIHELKPHRLLGVGDAAQCIYAFRNADPDLIEKFKDVPGTITLPLEDNYRSGPEILDVANHIIQKSSTALTLQANRTQSSDTHFHAFFSEYEEAQAALDWIMEKQDEGILPPQTAVLCRTKRTWIHLEILLRRYKIPYKTYGGISIAERAEIQDMVAFLRLDYNPKDATAWIRAAVLFPKFGMAGAEKLMSKYLPDAIPAKEAPKPLEPMREIVEELKILSTLPQKLNYLLEELAPLLEVQYKEDWEDRLETLQDFVNNAIEEELEMDELLESFALEKGEGPNHPEDAIVLSTVHSAKGLEWECVWFLGTGENQIPHKMAVTPQEKEEERRLTYVAVTRAKNELVCSYPRSLYGSYQGPSPYLHSHFQKKRD